MTPFWKWKKRALAAEKLVFELRQVENTMMRAKAQRDKFESEKNDALQYAEVCKAQLLQLRVQQHTAGDGRIGWMVAAFIPNEVLLKLTKENVDGFLNSIAKPMLRNAIKGIFRLLPHSGRVQGLVFGPVVTEIDRAEIDKLDDLPCIEANPSTGEAWETKKEMARIAMGVHPQPGRKIMPPGKLALASTSVVERE